MATIYPPFSVEDITDIGHYIYTDDGVNQMLYISTDGLGAPTDKVIGDLIMSATSQFDGKTVSSRTDYNIYEKVLSKFQIEQKLGMQIEIVDTRAWLALNGDIARLPNGDAELVNSKSPKSLLESYFEEIIEIPEYSVLNPSHIIVNSSNYNDATFNSLSYTNFFVFADDYSATPITLTQSGTSSERRTISLYDGKTTHPYNLPDNEQANMLLTFTGAEYWDIDRISELGIGTTKRLFMDSSNNRFNKFYMSDFYYGFYIRGTSSNNLWQRCYLDTQTHQGRLDDGVAWALADETKTNLTHNNKLILSDIRNAGDGIQVLMNGTIWGYDYQGTVLDMNHVWIDDEIYSDVDGNYDTNGEYHVGEDGIDIKAGSINPLNPMIVTNNVVHGFNHNAPIGNISSGVGTAFQYHFTAQNVLHMNNIVYNCGQALSVADGRDYSSENPSLYAMRDSTIRNNIASKIMYTNPSDTKPYVMSINTSNNVDILHNTVSDIQGDSSGNADAFWLSSLSVDTPLINNVVLGAETNINSGGQVAYNNIQDASLASLSEVTLVSNVANKSITVPYAESSLGGATLTKPYTYIFGSDGDVLSTTGKSTLLDATQSITYSFESCNYVRYYKDNEIVENFTVGQTSLTLTDGEFRDVFVSLLPPDMADINYMKANSELAFRHFNEDDSYVDVNISYSVADCKVYAPLFDIGEFQRNYRIAKPITNGSFDTDLGGWVNTWWEWSNGRAYHPLTANLNTMSHSVGGLTSFRVTFTVEVVSGSIKLVRNTGAGQDAELFETYTSGTFTVDVVDMSTSTHIGFGRNTEGEFYVDDVTIRVGSEIANYTVACDNESSYAIQKIYFNDDMTKADTMHISTEYNQIIAVVPTEAYTVKWTTLNNTTYELSTFTTNIDTNQMLAHMGVSDAEVKSIEII